MAPNVTLVSLRAGQDRATSSSGPSVDALTYAGNNGVDVVNMTYYIDPWLYNCNEQRGGLARGAGGAGHDHRGDPARPDYARARGVALVGSGNGHTDKTRPARTPQPRISPGAANPRSVTADCLTMPNEGTG